jgi:hypothetical protein
MAPICDVHRDDEDVVLTASMGMVDCICPSGK